jgi:hypothetical protein
MDKTCPSYYYSYVVRAEMIVVDNLFASPAEKTWGAI